MIDLFDISTKDINLCYVVDKKAINDAKTNAIALDLKELHSTDTLLTPIIYKRKPTLMDKLKTFIFNKLCG
jgi:ribonuclease HIII